MVVLVLFELPLQFVNALLSKVEGVLKLYPVSDGILTTNT